MAKHRMTDVAITALIAPCANDLRTRVGTSTGTVDHDHRREVVA
ncbi:MAG: hypothetical protein U1E70_02455 [Acetobacteraceae bacterium]